MTRGDLSMNTGLVSLPKTPAGLCLQKKQKYETRGEAYQSPRLFRGLGKLPNGT